MTVEQFDLYRVENSYQNHLNNLMENIKLVEQRVDCGKHIAAKEEKEYLMAEVTKLIALSKNRQELI